MVHEIKNLKTWDFVKTKPHSLQTIKDTSPSSYLYQLSDGIYYPAIRVSDLPDNFKIVNQ